MVQLASSLIPKADNLPGAMTRDPRLLPAWDVSQNGPMIGGAGATYLSNNAGFFGSLSYYGALATGAVANVYKTICDITGSGNLFHVVSPAVGAQTDDTSFRITVDDIVYEIIKTQSLIGTPSQLARVVLGACSDNSFSDIYTSNGLLFTHYSPTSGSGGPSATLLRPAGSVVLVQPSVIKRDGLPSLRFDKNLKVEVKVTSVFDTGLGAYCGASYLLD